MTNQLLTSLFVGALFAAAGCTTSAPVAPFSSAGPRFSQVPADGNGNKQVIPIDAQFPDVFTCANGAILDLRVVGWVQIWVTSQPDNRNVTLDAVNVLFTFTNGAGAAFEWREVGNDQFYVDQNGDLIHVLTGRDGGDGVIGRLVINTVTGEVTFVAGDQNGTRNDRACAALT
ncbi:MAG TPA: hypothetical protein VIW26_02290 [Gemmatimonadales bacterium]|jgi:hypothetical protein